MKKGFEIQEGKAFIQTAWLSGAKYEKGTGYVELTFSPYLKPYMLQLNSMFTQYKLANILNMKSKYSPRIYEFLKCNEFKKQGYIEIEIDELRKLLKADNVYPKYNDFKRFIIERTQKELKKLTDINFSFEEIKTGRKVTTLRFYINSNNVKVKALDEISVTKTEEYEEVPLDILENSIRKIIAITDNKLRPSEANAVWGDSEGDIDVIKKVYEYSKTQNIQNGLVGFMRKLVRPGAFNEPKKSTKQLKFDNFTSRSYDYEKLEKQLLGWDK